MELKQLKYFVTVAETGSFNKAATLLYTSQPNVSKIIKNLEEVLNISLFERTSKGVSLTTSGKKIYDHAKNVLKNAYLISQMAKERSTEMFSISCFPSVMVSGIFRKFYSEEVNNEDTQLELLEGTVEEIMENVEKGRSEIGILYYANRKEVIFKHILDHKHLDFVKIEDARLCLYPGVKSNIYNRKKISIKELSKVKLIHLPKDFFAIEHDLDMVSVGVMSMNNLLNSVSTNSDNLLVDMLSNTDVCYIGLYLMHDNLRLPNMNVVEIEGVDKSLILGFVKRRESNLSKKAETFIEYLKRMINSAER